MKPSVLLSCTALLLVGVRGRATSVVTVFDSGGFESYHTGSLTGQQGWRLDEFDPSLPNRGAAIAAAPGGHGNAIRFDDGPGTESPIAVDFSNLIPQYQYMTVSFDLFRDGLANFNNFWWSSIGSPSTAMYGLVSGQPAPQILPLGYFAGAEAMPSAQWTSVTLQYDLAHGLAQAYLDGASFADAAPVGVDPVVSGWNFTDQGGVGAAQTTYVDNFRILASDHAVVPEPASLMLLTATTALWLPFRTRRASMK